MSATPSIPKPLPWWAFLAAALCAGVFLVSSVMYGMVGNQLMMFLAAMVGASNLTLLPTLYALRNWLKCEIQVPNPTSARRGLLIAAMALLLVMAGCAVGMVTIFQRGEPSHIVILGFFAAAAHLNSCFLLGLRASIVASPVHAVIRPEMLVDTPVTL